MMGITGRMGCRSVGFFGKKSRAQDGGGGCIPAETMEMAGFFAAHAVWSVSDGETLVPMLAIEDAAGQRSMARLAADRLEQAVASGQEQLRANPAGARRAVLIFDGFVTLESGRTDALVLEIRDYERTAAAKCMIPYRPVRDDASFAVFRPKFVLDKADGENMSLLGEAFFRGVDAHEHGSK